MYSINTVDTQQAMAEAFQEYGMPDAIRTDNGVPFASCTPAGLTRLGVWWARLGIKQERIQPGHPEQNGRHERMHLTLKRGTTRPAQRSLSQQQKVFDEFQKHFNFERPHEACDQKPPISRHKKSRRQYVAAPPDPEYPNHDEERRVYRSGSIRLRETPVYISYVLAEELIGLREMEDDCWLISFAHLDLGFLKRGAEKLVPIEPKGRSWNYQYYRKRR